MSLFSPILERLPRRKRRRPRTWKERGFACLFVVVLVGDLTIVFFGSGLISTFVAPKNYFTVPEVGFALPGLLYGFYDIDTFLTINATSPYGFQYVQAERIHVQVEAIVNNQDYNVTSNRLYLSFQSAQSFNLVSNGCGPVQSPPPLGIRLVKYLDGVPSHWRGEGDICFLYSGDFPPVLTVIEANKTRAQGFIQLRQGIGENYVLPVAPAQSIEEFYLSSVNVFLTIGLYFFGLLESYHVLSVLYPKGFPHRIEYEENEVEKLDVEADPGQPDPKPKEVGISEGTKDRGDKHDAKPEEE